jgi:hypothetical protein
VLCEVVTHHPGDCSKPARTVEMGQARSSAEATVPRLCRSWFRIIELGVFHVADGDDSY